MIPESEPQDPIRAACVPDGVRCRLASLRQMIGNTPLVELRCRYRDQEAIVYAKHEVLNLTGSIKDRMALGMLEAAYERSEIRPGDTIVEATSGNTGISFASLGCALGHPVRIYMPDWMSQERVQLIRSMGAAIVPVSAEEGGFLGSIALADAFAVDNESVYRPQQFDSQDNIEAHRRTTGPELLHQIRREGREPAAFVAGVGTGGTVMGVGAHLRRDLGQVAIHPLEPANSPTLREGKKVGAHRIQGISDEFIPAIVDLEWLGSIVDVWDGDAILMAQRLASRLGLGVGISSGANLIGALEVAGDLGDGAVVATVFPDSNKKYLSTDLCGGEEPGDGYVTPEVEFLSCRVLPRAGTV